MPLQVLTVFCTNALLEHCHIAKSTAWETSTAEGHHIHMDIITITSGSGEWQIGEWILAEKPPRLPLHKEDVDEKQHEKQNGDAFLIICKSTENGRGT